MNTFGFRPYVGTSQSLINHDVQQFVNTSQFPQYANIQSGNIIHKPQPLRPRSVKLRIVSGSGN
uniref:Uncharacterized protein n=1 Tax=Meloidogyne enterolobii TaxID=390850 RepID=A0A6V7VG01_MELEN|nr:unnamed protein product [Meloidogyne enterolobii]